MTLVCHVGHDIRSSGRAALPLSLVSPSGRLSTNNKALKRCARLRPGREVARSGVHPSRQRLATAGGSWYKAKIPKQHSPRLT